MMEADPETGSPMVVFSCTTRGSIFTGVKISPRTVNRQCSSGLQACADVAAAIKAGYYDVGIAAGVETMTSNPMKWEGGMNPRVASSSDAQSCLIPMGVTSENVAERWCVYFYFRHHYGQLV